MELIGLWPFSNFLGIGCLFSEMYKMGCVCMRYGKVRTPLAYTILSGGKGVEVMTGDLKKISHHIVEIKKSILRGYNSITEHQQ